MQGQLAKAEALLGPEQCVGQERLVALLGQQQAVQVQTYHEKEESQQQLRQLSEEGQQRHGCI